MLPYAVIPVKIGLVMTKNWVQKFVIFLKLYILIQLFSLLYNKVKWLFDTGDCSTNLFIYWSQPSPPSPPPPKKNGIKLFNWIDILFLINWCVGLFNPCYLIARNKLPIPHNYILSIWHFYLTTKKQVLPFICKQNYKNVLHGI